MILPGYQDLKIHIFLFFKQEEGTPFSVVYGYESWTICVGPATGCLKLSVQAWLSTNSLNSNYTKIQLYLLSGLSFAYNNSEPYNDTKSDRPLCEHLKLWTEKQDHIQWDNCCGTEGVILINGSYGIVWDWSPKGQAVSNCSHQNQSCNPHKRLCWQVQKVFDHANITTHSDHLIIWHGSGMSLKEEGKKRFGNWL